MQFGNVKQTYGEQKARRPLSDLARRRRPFHAHVAYRDFGTSPLEKGADDFRRLSLNCLTGNE